jgi:hypothetical protein
MMWRERKRETPPNLGVQRGGLDHFDDMRGGSRADDLAADRGQVNGSARYRTSGEARRAGRR